MGRKGAASFTTVASCDDAKTSSTRVVVVEHIAELLSSLSNKKKKGFLSSKVESMMLNQESCLYSASFVVSHLQIIAAPREKRKESGTVCGKKECARFSAYEEKDDADGTTLSVVFSKSYHVQ
jgi:hypothetical protein